MRCALGGQRIRNMATRRMRAMSGGIGGVIVSITESGTAEGFCEITTSEPHGLSNVAVVIAGNSVGGYNTTHNIQDAETPTTFRTDVPYTADGTGGTWRRA